MQMPIRIELPTMFGMKTVNSYLFIAPEPILIDCGEKSKGSWTALQEGLKAAGLQVRDIQKVIITHAHIDHMGMAGRVVEASGAEVMLSEGAYDWAVRLDEMRSNRVSLVNQTVGHLFDPDTPNVIRDSLYRIFNSFSDSWDPIPESQLHVIQEGDTIRLGGLDWETLHLPGHCINQLGFYQSENRKLISADMLLSITPTPVIDPEPTNPSHRINSMQQLLHTFQKLRKLDIDQAFPGHYESFSDIHPLIDKQVARIHHRKTDCLKLVRDGNTRFQDLLQGMYRERMSLAAVPMLIGYLDLLETEGSIVRQEKDGYQEILAV